MTSCAYCKALEKGVDAVYSDDLFVALVPNKPWVAGHMILLPRRHVPIFEHLSEQEVDRMFVVANRLGVAAFQAVDSHGSNFIINNGVGAGQQFAHLMMHILPRIDEDGIDFVLPSLNVSQGRLDEVEQALCASAKVEVPRHPDDWILDHLTRLP